MKRIIFGLFLSICSLSYGQYNIDNIGKYWYYSQRFKDNFIVISSGNEQGTNIPATIVGEDGLMNWNDGNSGMQFYIGMLATEYRMLKDHGLDYQNTLNQLDWAIKAVERIDANAETYWNGGACANGYFIRDDVPSNLANWAVSSGKNLNFAGRSIESTFTDYSPALDNSQDNVWNYLPNFALVVKLVDEPAIVSRVKTLAANMVDYMHGFDWTSCPFDRHDLDYDCPGGWELNLGYTSNKCYLPAWIIVNPQTENLAHYGGHIYEGTPLDHSGRQWGFAEAAEFIAGGDHHYNGSSNERAIMVNMANLANDDESWSFKQLFTTIGYYWEYISTRFDAQDPFHEHLPLVWSLLHENLNIGETGQWSTVYENLLNIAPICGPHYYSNGDHYPYWDFKNRLNSNPGPPNPSIYGDYGGVDYMLLHNLYWLVYHPVKAVNLNYPQASGYGSNSNPAIIEAGDINSTEIINSGGNVTYNADALITLKPGFIAYNGCVFMADINGSAPVYNDGTIASPSCETIGLNSLSLKSSVTNTSVKETFFNKNVVQKNENGLAFTLSPNPANTYIEVHVFGDIENDSYFELLNSNGITFMQGLIPSNVFQLEISSLQSGLYLMKITSKGNTYIKNMIKR